MPTDINEPKWVVKAVTPRDDHTLDVVFSDGLKKRYDVKPLLGYPAFQALNDVTVFMGARVAFDSVAWGDAIDIAPETLYEDGVPIA